MAKLPKANFMCEYYIDCVLTRPELAAYIGAICANWSIIEDRLNALFGQLINFLTSHTPGTIPIEHRAILDDFNTSHSVNLRLQRLYKLVRTLERKHILTTTERKTFSALRKKTMEVSRKRGNIVHGMWTISEKYPDALLLGTGPHLPAIYKKPDFQAITNEINALDVDLCKFIKSIFLRFHGRT